METIINAFKKNPFLWVLGLVLLIFLLLWLFCNKPKNSLVEIKSPIQAPTGIAFIEVSNQSLRNVPNVKVTLIDTVGQVLSPNGIPFKTINVIGGVMSVGLSTKAAFSPERPYRFFVKAEADGYMTNIKSVVITADRANYVPIYMVKLNDLPGTGLASSVATTVDVVGGNIGAEQTLVAMASGSQTPQITIKIPEGTQLLCEGRPIEARGRLSYRLLTGNPLDSAANLVFPGGYEVTDAVDENGESIKDITPGNPAYFRSAGWFSMDMKVGNEGVNGFSKPLEVEMPLAEGLLNQAGLPLKAGDKVPLWSMDNGTGVWKQEGETTILDDGTGSLRAVFKVSHLSTWNLDYWGLTCADNIEVTYTMGDFPGSYFTQYISASTNAVLKSSYMDVDFSTDGNLAVADYQLVLQRVPSENARLFVYDGNDQWFPVRGRSSVLNCTSSPNTLGRLGSPSFPCVSVQFVREAGGEPPLVCSNTVWQKPTCNPADLAIHAGSLKATNAGKVKVPLGAGGQQCLQLWYTRLVGGVPSEVLLTFRLDFSSSGSGDVWEGTNEAGAVSFSYTVTGAADGCGTAIRIVVPDSVLSGIVCI